MPATSPASPRSRLRVGARRPSVSDSSSTTTRTVGPTGGRPPAGGRPLTGPRGPEPALGQPGRQLGVGRQHAARSAGVAGVGQPFGPIPSAAARACEDHDRQVGRAVQRRRLAQQRAGERQRRARSPTMPTTPPADRSTGTGRPPAFAAVEAPRPARRAWRRCGVARSPGAPAHGAHAGPQQQEVAVARPRSHSVVLGSMTRRSTSAGSGLAAPAGAARRRPGPPACRGTRPARGRTARARCARTGGPCACRRWRWRWP